MPKSIRAAILADNAAEARHSDQRGEERLSLVVSQAVVVWRGRELEVSVCDVSAGGVMIETLDLRPKIGETVHLRIAECVPVKCTICWFKGCRIGLQFAHETSIDGPCEVQDFILRKLRGETRAASDRVQVPRPRRYRLIWQATLHHEDESTSARIRNISAQGAMIECGWDFHVGTEVLLDLEQAGTVFARVRWCQGGQVGLKFNTPFDLRSLAECKPKAAEAVPAHPFPTAAARARPNIRRGKRLSVSEIADLFR